MKTWETKDGKEIPIKELEDRQLLNIIKYVEKLAKKLDGKILFGECYDIETCWYETGDEEDWLKHLGYEDLVKEAKKRGLIKKTLRP